MAVMGEPLVLEVILHLLRYMVVLERRGSTEPFEHLLGCRWLLGRLRHHSLRQVVKVFDRV